jgi:RNA polymerase sigma factor for flagellar operon FliA
MSGSATDQTGDVASLWQNYQARKSIETRNRLAEYYLPLVKIVAARMAIGLPPYADRDDLLSSGFLGLLDAIVRYDADRKIKFETYASLRVRGAMLDYLRSKDWISFTVRKKIRLYEEAVANLENRLGRAAEDGEIAAAMGISLDELHSMISSIRVATIVPLDEYVRTEEPDSLQPEPTENMEQEDVRRTLAQAIDRLPEKEKLVVSLYYYEELTLKEISKILNVSEARVSQMHTKAVFRLRGALARLKASLM